jgi:hypothetical protein
MEAQDHKRFRRLVRGIVEHRLSSAAPSQRTWIGECYDSLEAFVHYFPDPVERRNWIAEFEEEAAEIKGALDAKLDQLLTDGFTYEDLEQQRYEFRGPDGSSS